MEVLLGPPSYAPPPTPYSAASLSPDTPSADAETLNPSGSALRESGSGSSIGENSSESSSSIGVPDDESDDGVQSKAKEEGGLCGLDSLEDALPIKRGLSRHFSGKSKSFASLSDAIEVKDLEKPENAFNKRRRIVMASKWSRRGSFYNWPNPKSMPLLALNEDEDEEEEEEETKQVEVSVSDSDSDSEVKDRRRRSVGQRFKSMSCFDLQEYEQQ